MRTRSEHMAWCKQRALEYCDDGDTAGALASFVSDVSKHRDTSQLQGFAAAAGFAHAGSPQAMRRFIEGFAS